jgi:SAM-dependent methyltransferase
MNLKEEKEWFDALKSELEESYLRHNQPWEQSGFFISKEAWVKCRKPIADCIEKSGTFLDIGCANGFFLQCLLEWAGERGIEIIPYGLDLSERLIDLAKKRLPQYRRSFYIGNGWNWKSPIKFDYVRTEIAYVPESLQKPFIERIISLYLKAGGKLLVAEYRSRKDDPEKPWVDETLKSWGLKVAKKVSGFYDNKELTRVAVLDKS